MLSVKVKKKHLSGREVLGNISFDVPEGKIYSTMGKSGIGKTTLLRIISGLDEKYEGKVTLNNKSIVTPTKKIAVVFQESRLIPWKNVYENIEFATSPTDTDSSEINQVLNDVGYSQSTSLFPRELSGGMEKRVAIARALICKPQLILLDEPFSALDIDAKWLMQDLLKDYCMSKNVSMLMITHDIEEATYMSDSIIILDGKPAENKKEIKVPVECSDRQNEFFFKFQSKLAKTIMSLG